MPARRKRRSKSLAAMSAELAMAVPQVVAHRMTRMALAGSSPCARDRKEFERMGAEKCAAFAESWNAMAAQAVRANQALGFSVLRTFWLSGRAPSANAIARQMSRGALGVVGKGIAPLHRKAVANAKRLARAKRR
jgi:hypothetical protein